MAKVTLKNLSHSYLNNPQKDTDFVITDVNIDWRMVELMHYLALQVVERQLF